MTQRQHPAGAPQSITPIVQEALEHFHDPAWLSRSPLAEWQIVRQRIPPAGDAPTAERKGHVLQAVLWEALEALKPDHPAALHDTQGRAYLLLDHVYRRRRSARHVYEEVLHLSKTQFYRERKAAFVALARLLQRWEEEALARLDGRGSLPPATYTRLFGVEETMERLLALLSDETAADVVIVDGLGGVGKTALGREVARHLLRRGIFGRLVWETAQRALFTWGEIEPVDRPALTSGALLDAIARTLDAGELLPLPVARKRNLLRRRLAQDPTLIVVDNLETAADVSALVETVHALSQSPQVKVLLTSRYRLDGLAPFAAHHLRPLSEAATLDFVRYLAAERGESALAAADTATLRPIYAVSGGNPLAVKLIVSQAGALPLQQVLGRLQEPAGGGQPLYTYIYRHAWEMLSEPAREVLLSLPHLAPAGARWEEIAALVDLPPAQLGQALNELVRLSLVNAAGDAEHSYTLHPLTRQFILSDLVEAWE